MGIISHDEVREALRTLGHHADRPLHLEVKLTAEELKKVWRSLARRYHPDRNKNSNASDIFKACNAAYHKIEGHLQAGGRLPAPDPHYGRQATQAAPEPQPQPQARQRRKVRRRRKVQPAPTPGETKDEAYRRRAQELQEQFESSGSTVYTQPFWGRQMDPFGAQPNQSTWEYQAWGTQPGQAPTRQTPFGQSVVEEGPLVDILRGVGVVTQILQQQGVSGFVGDIANMLGGHATTSSAGARLTISHEQLMAYNAARTQGVAAIIEGTLEVPGQRPQSGHFQVQINGAQATANGIPCSVHVR